jgi:malonyl-CoA/methylmalonyl-CoA synthetase
MPPDPPWLPHLRAGSALPSDAKAARLVLRAGNLRDELLKPGPQPTLRVGDLELSRDDLRARVEAVAGGLRTFGITRGSMVSLYAPNSLSWITTYLGVIHLGATVNAINPAYRQEELRHILSDASPALVITDEAGQSLVRAVSPNTTAVLLDEIPHGAPPARQEIKPEDPALLLYTSGTTGRPKGALLDHGNMLAQARGVVEAWRWGSGDRLVHALPLFHVHGLGIAFHGTLVAGASMTLISFSPEAVVAELQRDGTMFFGVPAMYQRLVEYLEQHPADLAHVRLFVAGSAPLPPALFERAAKALGQPVLERYGITEGGIAVSNPYDGPRRPGRVGYPLPGVEVRLGDKSEVLLRGGQVFSGYWHNEAATREALEDGWLHTGDVGEIDEDGTLAIRGRLKELIITGGFNVYPREVELVLEQHPAVAEVAVVGIPSEQWGEEVTAFVVAREPVKPEAIIAFARERLSTYKCPRVVRFIDVLPRNAMGKVQKSQLQASEPPPNPA